MHINKKILQTLTLIITVFFSTPGSANSFFCESCGGVFGSGEEDCYDVNIGADLCVLDTYYCYNYGNCENGKVLPDNE